MHVFPSFIHKRGEEFLFMHICFVLQKGREEFDEKDRIVGGLLKYTIYTHTQDLDVFFIKEFSFW